jgi:UDP-glucose 4-epimerase
VQNLNSAISLTLVDQRSRGETFIVADPVPITIADLIRRYRSDFGRPAGLFTVPDRLFELGLRVTGRSAIWHRIGCPLIAKPEKLLGLGWNPS